MITLYFVDGISVNDEPTFEGLALQDKFFSKHIVKNIDTGFYPPHYVNRIKLSIDDFDLRKQINYLSLVYNDKTYYYFIDAIEYINEDIYQLNVVMDTIQTYMFNIHCDNALVERMCIQRWYSDRTINRNYLRENIADDTFDGSYYNLSNKLSGLTIHVAIVAQPEASWVWEKKVYTNINNRRMNQNNNSLVVLYIAIDDYQAFENINKPTIEIKEVQLKAGDIIKKYSTSTDEVNIPQALVNISYKFASEPSISNIYKIPIEFLNINITQDGDKIIYNLDENYAKYDSNTVSLDIINKYGMMMKDYYNKPFINTFDFGKQKSINRNTLLGVPFEYSFCPCILDTNYMRISYGDMQVQTTYPLEYLKDTNLYMYANINILTGEMRYQISTEDILNVLDYGYKDLYDSITYSSIDLSIPRLTNYYNEYDKANKARGLDFVGSLVSSSLCGLPRVSTTHETMTTKEIVSKRLRTTTKRTLDRTSETSGTNILRGIGGIVGNTIDFVSNEINHALMPNDLKNTTNSSNTFAYGMNQIRLKVFDTRNVEQCAKYFESVGYKINEWYNNLEIFKDNSPISIRYYFNVIKTQDMTIDLYNCPSDNSTIDSILQRFYDGVRLWRVDSEGKLYGKMGQPTLYDNVERSFVTND